MPRKKTCPRILVCALALVFSACGAAAEESPLAAVLPDQASQIQASYFDGGGITTWELTQEEFESPKAWALDLPLEVQTFAQGESPGDRDGGSGYTFQWGEHSFSYILSGDADYVLLGDTWYLVASPSRPPVAVPGHLPLRAEDVETAEAYHYIVPADAEKKVLTDAAAIQEVLDLLDRAEASNRLPESITGGAVVSFRLYLSGGEVREWVCEESADSFWTVYGPGGTALTTVDCAQVWASLPGEAVAAGEEELPSPA